MKHRRLGTLHVLQMSYTLLPTIDKAIQTMERLCGPSSEHEFIDGVQLANSKHAIVVVADFYQAPFLQQTDSANVKAADRPASVTSGFKDEPSPKKCKVLSLGRPWNLWFYEHLSRVAEKLRRKHPDLMKRSDFHIEGDFFEIVKTEDYLFRYDYGAFWMARPMTWGAKNTRYDVTSLISAVLMLLSF